MRVAFFVPSFPEISETFILQQVVGLLDRGHEVRIFAYKAANDGPVHGAVARYGLAKTVRVLPNRRDGAESVSVAADGHPQSRAWLSAGLSILPSLGREYARSMGGWRTLVRTLRTLSEEHTFDVVHCHYGNIGVRYRVASRLWRAPLLVSFYGYDCSSYPRAHGSQVYQSLFRDADAVAVLSDHMGAQLGRLGCPQDLLRRVPLAIDSTICDHSTPQQASRSAFRVLTVARLTEKKGIEYALRALARLIGDYPDLEYHVIGAGPLLPAMKELAASLGLQRNVQFLGAQTLDVVRDELRDAHVFLLPSVTATDGDQEGTPTAIIEAAYCGLPVVSTLHSGIPELVRDGESGFLVPERDVDALAERLGVLLRAPDLRSKMGAAGRRYAEATHTTAAVAERLERVYAELLRPSARAGGR